MPILLPSSSHSKSATHSKQGVLEKRLTVGRHATVNCKTCHRFMVPRVVSYYGQPLKSICPFCGTTFMRFSSGFQRFMQRFHSHTLTFTVFKQFLIITLCFGLVWFSSTWINLSVNLGLFAVLGTLGFGLITLAELFVQCVEHITARLSHESTYYWLSLIVIVVLMANLHDDLSRYIIFFSIVMLVRWFIAGLVKAFNGTQ